MLKEDLYQIMHFIIKTINDENGKETAEFNVKDYEGMFNSKNPKESHNNWMNAKIKDGWIYGEAKDIDKKTHPCLIPYEKLPYEEKIKDWISLGIAKYWNEINSITDVKILNFSIYNDFSYILTNDASGISLRYLNNEYCEFNYKYYVSDLNLLYLSSKDDIKVKFKIYFKGKEYEFSNFLNKKVFYTLLEQGKNLLGNTYHVCRIRLSRDI
jgi:hypothetical protein